MELPDKIIFEVFSYIPDQFTISQVCQKFYAISCELKSFKVNFSSEIDKREEVWSESIPPSIFNRVVKGYIKQLDDDEIFSSMVKSDRKINSLEIAVKSNHNNSNVKLSFLQNKRLTQFLQYFGHQITELKISGLELPSNISKLLNLMPNLNNIVFFMVTVQPAVKMYELNFSVLSDLNCISCCQHVFKMFNFIPSNTLKTIKISQQEEIIYDSVKLFKNQLSIEEVEVDGSLVHLIDWKHLKLLKIKISSFNFPLTKYLEYQVELKYLSSPLNQNELNLICNKLKSLETLNILVNQTLVYEFSELSKLTSLTSLCVVWARGNNRTINESLKLFSSKSLINLELGCNKVKILPSTISKLGNSCSSVKFLQMNSNSHSSLVKTIFDSFPCLESLNFLTQSFQINRFEKDSSEGYKVVRSK